MLKAANEALEHLETQRPDALAEVRLPCDVGELAALISVLEETAPSIDDELRASVDAMRTGAAGKKRTSRRAPLGVAAALAVVGAVVAAAVAPAVGGALVAVALIVAVMTLWLGREQPNAPAAGALMAAERLLADQQAAVDALIGRKATAVASCNRSGCRQSRGRFAR